jgi:hypothetical protein
MGNFIDRCYGWDSRKPNRADRSPSDTADDPNNQKSCCSRSETRIVAQNRVMMMAVWYWHCDTVEVHPEKSGNLKCHAERSKVSRHKGNMFLGNQDH